MLNTQVYLWMFVSIDYEGNRIKPIQKKWEAGIEWSVFFLEVFDHSEGGWPTFVNSQLYVN